MKKKDFLSFEKIDLYSLKKKSLGKKKIFTFQNSFSEKQIKKKKKQFLENSNFQENCFENSFFFLTDSYKNSPFL